MLNNNYIALFMHIYETICIAQNIHVYEHTCTFYMQILATVHSALDMQILD